MRARTIAVFRGSFACSLAVLVGGCGSSASPAVPPDVARDLTTRIAAVRTATAGGDRDEAGRALRSLSAAVRARRAAGALSTADAEALRIGIGRIRDRVARDLRAPTTAPAATPAATAPSPVESPTATTATPTVDPPAEGGVPGAGGGPKGRGGDTPEDNGKGKGRGSAKGKGEPAGKGKGGPKGDGTAGGKG